MFVRLADPLDRPLWGAERLLPLFPGWEVVPTDCVDGWGLTFKGRPLAEVMRRISEIIERRE